MNTILYDGWALCRAPLSPPALHLLDLLANRPDGFVFHIALPVDAPEWLPEDLSRHVIETPDTPGAQLRWEQRVLPGLARKLDAGLHLTTTTAPLAAAGPVFVSPAGDGETGGRGAGVVRRLRSAMGRGGMANAQIFWPENIASPVGTRAPIKLPGVVDPRFKPHNFFLPPAIPNAPELPASFFLVHIRPDRPAIRQALEAWTWAAGPIGEVYPLVFMDLPKDFQKYVLELTREFKIHAETMVFYPEISPADLHLVYQAASAVFLPQPASPWSSPLHYGIACGKPVIAIETAISSSIAGSAAYLIPDMDPRSLGAALIAVVVKDDLRKKLVDAALDRVKGWSTADFKMKVGKAYNKESAPAGDQGISR